MKLIKNRHITPNFSCFPVNTHTLGEQEMSVKLKPHHLEVIIDALQAVCDYKVRALRHVSWQKFQNEYLVSIVEQIQQNEFKLNNSKSNSLNWLLDQLCWSRVVLDGVPLKDCLPLIDTRLGQEASEILRNAARGQKHYDQYFTGSNFRNLFDSD
jgi:hypothetical protein